MFGPLILFGTTPRRKCWTSSGGFGVLCIFAAALRALKTAALLPGVTTGRRVRAIGCLGSYLSRLNVGLRGSADALLYIGTGAGEACGEVVVLVYRCLVGARSGWNS